MIGDKLHVVVCLKYTVSAAGASLAARPGAKNVPMAISPFDEFAIEEGVRIKERLNGAAVVTAVTLGGPEAVEGLRDAISRGCDDAVLLNSPDFAGSDTNATGRSLSEAIKKLSKDKGPVDLAIFGKNTNDSDMGQVAPATAVHWGVPSVAFVKKVEEIQPGAPGRLVVHRTVEDGVEVLELPLPAAFSTVKEINEPRIPALKGKMAAKKAVIPSWGPTELGLDKTQVGAAGSLASWTEPVPIPARQGGEKVDGGTPQEKAKNLFLKLKERRLV